MGESDLAGAFGCFGIREIIDLLNNGFKSGVLEVETEHCRIFVYVERGRIQAVTASGVDPADVARHMPEALSELAPVIKFTIAGRRGSEVDGLVELLNNKVLDPRLLEETIAVTGSGAVEILLPAGPEVISIRSAATDSRPVQEITTRGQFAFIAGRRCLDL